MIRGGVGATSRACTSRSTARPVGCPALRPEAYRGDALETQLADQARRFLADRSRNRYDAASGRLEVSQIFEWYGQDFERAAGTVAKFLAAYAPQLSDDDDGRGRIAAARAAGRVPRLRLAPQRRGSRNP